jgi:general stress protein 26
MNEPVTELDARFSEPNSEPTPWSKTQEVLASAQLAWVTTVRSDGRPHVTPLVAVWLDGAFHFCTGADEQKGINLATNRHVVLTTGCNHWDRGLDVIVEGVARRVTDRATLERLAAAWATKWDGTWRFEVADDGFHHATPAETPSSPETDAVALVFAVEPTKVLAFGKGKGNFTHTRYVPAGR